MPVDVLKGSGGSRRQAPIAYCCALLVLIAGHTAGASAAAERSFPITVARSFHGGILPSHPAPVAPGGSVRLAIFPRTGYHLDSLFVDGVAVRRARVLVLRAVRAPHHVSATFAPDVHVILATAGLHVTMEPSGVVPVSHGRSQSFLFAADSGFKVQEVLVDGSPVPARTRYTFTNVRTGHTILVRTEHHAATVIAPEPDALWLAGETREVRWQPLDGEDVDSAEVRVSYHGPDGPWAPVWRGLFRTGSAEWEVPEVDCDSLVVCVATIDSVAAPGADYSNGFVHVRSTLVDSGRFYVRATPSPAPVGPVRIEYSLPVPGEGTLGIYTVSGREVWRRILGSASTGRRSATWDGRLAGGGPAVPGIYFARLSTPQGQRNCRLVLVP